MKQQSYTTNDRPNQILTFSTATALYEVKARLPQPDTVKCYVVPEHNTVLLREHICFRPASSRRHQDPLKFPQNTTTVSSTSLEHGRSTPNQQCL